MIVNRGSGRTYRKRIGVPLPPLFAREWFSFCRPLARSSWYPALDHLSLVGVAPGRIEVSVDRSDEFELPADPTVVDLTGPQEMIFSCASTLGALDRNVVLLISPESGMPQVEGEPLIIISCWPLWIEQIRRLAEVCSDRQYRWGLFLPILVPGTEALPVIEELASIARNHGASVFAGEPFSMSAEGKRALLDRAMSVDDETWSKTYAEQDHELIGIATARHVAALARELDLPWWIEWEGRDNWGGAAHLSRIGTQIASMGRSPEVASVFTKAANAVAALDRPIAQIAESASLTIVDHIEELAEEVLLEWLERGSSAIAEETDDEWCLRRDELR